MKLKRLSIGILSLLLLIGCGNKQDNKGQQQIPEYETLVVSEKDAELETVFPVTIKGKEDVEIRPRIDGFIDAIYIDEGSVVKKGQILFKINSPSTEQAVVSAEATVSSAQASLNTAELNVKRIRPLAEKGIVSNTQLETYENTYSSAQASLNQALATLKSARESRTWASVSSPVNGVVGEISFRLGSLVNSNNVLTTVANIGNVYANFSMNEKDMLTFLKDIEGKTQAEKIKNIPPVTLTLVNGEKYSEKGKIETITGTVNVTTGTANFRAEFPNPNGKLRSGTSGRISIPKYVKNVIVIPQKATKTLQNKILVFVVNNESKTKQTPVSVIPTPDGQNYIVTEGLKAGDRIVSEGMATIQDNMEIKTK